jgi:hypothetical protein
VRERIFALQRRRHDLIDRGGDHLLFSDGGEAVADAAVVGLHGDEAA